MKKIIFTVCLLLVPVLCTAISTTPTPQQPNMIDAGKPFLTLSQEAKWTQLTGRWFGSELTKTGGKVMWIAERRNDGTYKIQFRRVDTSGKTQEKVETGEWGVSGDIYFTTYKAYLVGDKVVSVDPTDPYNRDAYRIINLTNETFEYVSVDSSNKYTVRKVPADFKFPE